MALHHNPRIVTSGLVLALDAADTNSYPGSGTTWYDISGNGNHATLNGGPTFETDGIGSFYFDQTNDTATTGLTGGDLGISDNAISGQIILKKDSTTTNNLQGHMGFGGDDNLGPNIKTTNTKYFLDIRNAASTRVLLDFHSNTFGATYQYTWLVICFTILGETVKTYTNGQFYDTTTLTGGVLTFQDKSFNMGNGFGYYRHQGNIASVKLYNRALTAEEVLQNYNATKTRFGL